MTTYQSIIVAFLRTNGRVERSFDILWMIVDSFHIYGLWWFCQTDELDYFWLVWHLYYLPHHPLYSFLEMNTQLWAKLSYRYWFECELFQAFKVIPKQISELGVVVLILSPNIAEDDADFVEIESRNDYVKADKWSLRHGVRISFSDQLSLGMFFYFGSLDW